METSDNNLTKTDLSTLNDAQRQAVVSESKRLLILAGAGSGKTKTLLQKIIYLIEEKGVSPITRTRDKLFLITDKGNESSFLKEIPGHYIVRASLPGNSSIGKNLTCPECLSQLEKLSPFCPECGTKLSG